MSVWKKIAEGQINDESKIVERLAKALVSFEQDNFNLFIKHLLLLREEISKIEPESLHLDFVDFLMDENMWDWVINSLKDDPSEHDLEAANFVAMDIKDLIKNNKILKE